MKKEISQFLAILVLLGLLGISIFLNFFHLNKINELSEDVVELHRQQSNLESTINQLHNLDGEDGHGH